MTHAPRWLVSFAPRGQNVARTAPRGVGLGLPSKDRGTAAILNGGHFEVRRRRPFDTSHLAAFARGSPGLLPASLTVCWAGDVDLVEVAACGALINARPIGRTELPVP